MRAVFLIVLSIYITPVMAADAGMFLCNSPVIANDFWNDLLAINSAGASVDRSISIQVAKKNACTFVAGEGLKPIDFVAGQMLITGETHRGWASPYLYISYVNRDSKK